MKRLALLLVVSLVLLPGVAGAMVIERGTFEVSGASQLTYWDTKFDYDTSGQSTDYTQFGISFMGNYYLRNNLGLGLYCSYASTEYNSDFVDTKETRLSLGPVLKYQFPVAERVNLFLLGSAGYQKYEFSNDTTSDGWYGTAGGGLSYYLTSSFSVDVLGRYEYDSLESGDTTMDGFFFGVGVSVFLR